MSEAGLSSPKAQGSHEDKRRARKEKAIWMALRFLRWSIGLTLRERVVAGENLLRRLQSERRPMILVYWHERTFLASDFTQEHLNRKGVHLTAMTSRSRDGGLIARLAAGWGYDIIRGSTSKGGAAALRAMVKAVKQKKTTAIIVPDGPRGPIYDFQKGAVLLSQLTGAPILPVGLAVEKCWRLRSWDRMIIPKPFSRMTIALGEPLSVERTKDEEALETSRLAAAAALDEATRLAEQALGGAFPDLEIHPELSPDGASDDT